MADLNASLKELLTIGGASAAAIVDSASGMLLAKDGSGIDLDLAAAVNTEVVKAKQKAIQALGLNDEIDDILITLGKQYHIIRPVEKHKSLFIYLILDKTDGNLALARIKVSSVGKALDI